MGAGRLLLLPLGAALGALFLYLAVRKLDWSAFAAEFGRAHPAQIALGLACLVVYYAVKTARWQRLIQPFAQARTRDLQQAVMAGLAGNLVFPHFGEIARSVLAARLLGVAPSALLGSIAIERFFDFLALLALVVVVLLPLGGIDEHVRTAAFAAAALCAVLLALVTLFMLHAEACIRIVQRLVSPVSARVGEMARYHLAQARIGLGAIGTAHLLLPIFCLSILQWVAILGCVIFSLRSLDMPVSLAAAVSVLLINVVGLTLPAAPGHVGTIQIAFIVGLAPFGATREEAFAASVVYNVLMVVPTVLLGLPGLRRAGGELQARLLAR